MGLMHYAGRRKPALAIIAGSVVLVSACGASTEKSNAFVSPLNQAVVHLESLESAGDGADPAQLQASIDASIPPMQASLDQMRLAEADLPEKLKPIGTVCIDQMQQIVDSLAGISAGISASDPNSTEAAANSLKQHAQTFETECQNPYNAAIGAS